MSDFSFLQKLSGADKTAYMQLSFSLKAPVAGEEVVYPRLKVRPATEANPAFANEQFRMAKKNQAIVRAGAFGMATLKEARDNDRVLYAKYIICGWDGIYDSHGEPVAYTAEECSLFLASLPDWAFDQIRAFCGDIQNFVDTQVSVEAISKN